MDKEESSIDRLKKALYSRNENLVPKEKRNPVSSREYDVPSSWGDKPSYDISPETIVKKNNSFFNKYLLGSIIFFIVSFAIASFIFLGGINTISSNNVDINIIAPSTISSGEELSIGLSIINGNRVTLEDVNLFIDYPEGTESVLQQNRPITYDTVSLGSIEAGGKKDHSLRVVLFGEKDSIKDFVYRIEYKVSGSNAVFSKEKVYEVKIGSSPVLLEVKYPREVNSGQNITINLEITSNSSVPIRDVIVKVEYPYGFTYRSSNIRPVRDDSVWSIGDMKNGDKKTIDITGTLLGQNLEDRSFRISAGTRVGSVYDFDTTLVSTLITMGIRKSFFDLNVSSSNNGIVSPGAPSINTVSWQNTLPDRVVDGVIEVKLSGNALDRSRVSVSNQGFYRSVDDTIIWDKSTTNSLSSMSPGDGGRFNFSVSSIDNLVQPNLIKNPYINLRVNMSGERVGRDGGEISSSEELVVKISSVVNLVSRSFKYTGPFSNSGPTPPKADQESTYTINWVLTNTTSDLRNTIVRGTLPIGVSWKGQISPSGEKVTFDPDTRVVTWDIGNVSAGTGFIYSPKQVYFKVGIVPSISQIGSAPVLVNQSTVSALDTHTELETRFNSSSVNTKYSDTQFRERDDIVVN